MKLSKEYLMLAFHLAIQHFTKNLKSYYNRQSFTDMELREMFDKCAATLEDGTLEIEGYERSGWTKFDPDDPKTFPIDLDEYLVRYSFGETGITSWDGKNLGFASSDRRYITHWRPLPNDPVETEETK